MIMRACPAGHAIPRRHSFPTGGTGSPGPASGRVAGSLRLDQEEPVEREFAGFQQGGSPRPALGLGDQGGAVRGVFGERIRAVQARDEAREVVADVAVVLLRPVLHHPDVEPPASEGPLVDLLGPWRNTPTPST